MSVHERESAVDEAAGGKRDVVAEGDDAKLSPIERQDEAAGAAPAPTAYHAFVGIAGVEDGELPFIVGLHPRRPVSAPARR